VLPLAQHFLAAARPEMKDSVFDPAVAAYVTRRDYPGNVRDLRQLVIRAASRHVGDGLITFADIPEDERPRVPLPLLPWPDFEFERAVERAITLGIGMKDISRIACDVAVRLAIQSRGNLQDAARLLGVSDRALQMRQAQSRTVDLQLN
jgi:DNA-binding NtrC family response regulator